MLGVIQSKTSFQSSLITTQSHFVKRKSVKVHVQTAVLLCRVSVYMKLRRSYQYPHKTHMHGVNGDGLGNL